MFDMAKHHLVNFFYLVVPVTYNTAYSLEMLTAHASQNHTGQILCSLPAEHELDTFYLPKEKKKGQTGWNQEVSEIQNMSLVK